MAFEVRLGELLVVVDLAVDRDGNRLVGAVERLVARARIDDAEAFVCKVPVFARNLMESAPVRPVQ